MNWWHRTKLQSDNAVPHIVSGSIRICDNIVISIYTTKTYNLKWESWVLLIHFEKWKYPREKLNVYLLDIQM